MWILQGNAFTSTHCPRNHNQSYAHAFQGFNLPITAASFIVAIFYSNTTLIFLCPGIVTRAIHIRSRGFTFPITAASIIVAIFYSSTTLIFMWWRHVDSQARLGFLWLLTKAKIQIKTKSHIESKDQIQQLTWWVLPSSCQIGHCICRSPALFRRRLGVHLSFGKASPCK